MARRLSGLQKDIIHLYRQCLRVSYTKPVQNRPHFINFVKAEFNKNKSTSRKDFNTIEYLIRTGKKKLEIYSANDVKDIFHL